MIWGDEYLKTNHNGINSSEVFSPFPEMTGTGWIWAAAPPARRTSISVKRAHLNHITVCGWLTYNLVQAVLAPFALEAISHTPQ